MKPASRHALSTRSWYTGTACRGGSTNALIGEDGQCYQLLFGDPVSRRDRRHKRLAHQHFTNQRGVVHGWPDEPDIQPALLQGLDLRGDRHRMQLHVHVIVSAVEPAHGPGRVHMVHAVADADPQLHRVGAACAARHQRRSIAARENVTCLFQKELRVKG